MTTLPLQTTTPSHFTWLKPYRWVMSLLAVTALSVGLAKTCTGCSSAARQAAIGCVASTDLMSRVLLVLLTWPADWQVKLQAIAAADGVSALRCVLEQPLPGDGPSTSTLHGLTSDLSLDKRRSAALQWLKAGTPNNR